MEPDFMDTKKSVSDVLDVELSFNGKLKYFIDKAKGAPPFYNKYQHRFFNAKKWKKIREEVIVRDKGCDLGDTSRPLTKPLIHHIIPLNDFNAEELMYDKDYLITCSYDTHMIIHGKRPIREKIVRREGDELCQIL